MRAPLVFVATFVLTACAGAQRPPAELPERPNIVFIMADDLGYGDLGSYGQDLIQTPRLDQMAAEGMRFTQFYAGSTVCAPSRSVLMTGLHTGTTRVRGNAGGRSMDHQALAPENVTVAEVLKGAGYATAHIGKWGLGDEGVASIGLPTRQGFDYFYGYLNQVHAHNHYPEFLWRNEERVPLRNVVTRAPRSYGGFTGGYATRKVEYTGDLFTDDAVAWITAHQDEPFFLYLSYVAPHANNEARHGPEHGMEVPDYGPYADRSWPDAQKGHAAMITRQDGDVGRILDTLRELDLDDRTVVFYTSDNGPHQEGGADPEFFDSNGPLRGIKRALYEGGIRVPMIVWGPGIVPEGATSDHVWAMWDFLPTAAALAGTAPPDDLDGLSMAPLLTGRGEAPEHTYLYWEFYEQGSRQAVRMGDWKAIRQPMFDGEVELYNLAVDLDESEDVSDAHPDLVEQAVRWMEQAHTPSELWTLSGE